MARKASERLATLLKLAAMKEQRAAKLLAGSGERLNQAKQQSQQLALYDQEYQKQYVSNARQTLNRRDLLNYQGFFRQLDHAQQQQRQTIVQRDQEREKARKHWLDLYAKRLLLNKVRERRLLREQQDQDRRLQREQDDRSQLIRRGGFDQDPNLR